MNCCSNREIALKAAAHAEQVRIECNISRIAPVDPILLADVRKCEIWFMPLPSLEGIYSPKPRFTIIIGSQRWAGRRAYTAAHELAHHEFNHGTRVDEINYDGFQNKKRDPDEFLADMFAAFLLMPQGGIRRTLKDRKLHPPHIEPMDIFKMAGYFGVGYATLINHMTFTLQILKRDHQERLLRVQPKQLKAQFGAPQSEVIIVDELWRDRAVDLEKGDILVLPKGIAIDNGSRLVAQGTIDGQQTFKAVSQGLTRAFHENGNWAVNVRVAPKHYEGLAQHRFLDDPEEDDE